MAGDGAPAATEAEVRRAHVLFQRSLGAAERRAAAADEGLLESLLELWRVLEEHARSSAHAYGAGVTRSALEGYQRRLDALEALLEEQGAAAAEASAEAAAEAAAEADPADAAPASAPAAPPIGGAAEEKRSGATRRGFLKESYQRVRRGRGEDALLEEEGAKNELTEELGGMAKALKAQSLQMNSALRQQNDEIGELEMMAARNEVDLELRTEETRKQIRRNRLGFCFSITLMASVVLTFIAAYLVVRVMPRGRRAAFVGGKGTLVGLAGDILREVRGGADTQLDAQLDAQMDAQLDAQMDAQAAAPALSEAELPPREEVDAGASADGEAGGAQAKAEAKAEAEAARGAGGGGTAVAEVEVDGLGGVAAQAAWLSDGGARGGAEAEGGAGEEGGGEGGAAAGAADGSAA